MRFFYIAALLFPVLLPAQKKTDHVATSTVTIGTSAISINTIVARSYRLNYPFYQYKADSASGRLFFTARQQADGGSLYLNKSFIGALNMDRDSLDWLFESTCYELSTPGNSLFFSNEDRTTRYSKLHGFEEIKFPFRLAYALPSANLGLTYKEAESSVLSCVDLSDGAVKWTGQIPAAENWVDVKLSADSVLLLAAAGLHAIQPGAGLLWSHPLATSTRVTKALTYSLANNNPSIRGISTVVKTSGDEYSVTELSSNILIDNGVAYFAGKEKMVAVAMDGKLLWELDLKEFPVSKMLLYKKGGALTLVNFGLANYQGHYVIYGSPFVLAIDPDKGSVKSRSSLSGIENLVDFAITPKSLVFAGKTAVLEVKEGGEAETILSVDAGKYGNFAEFIDGSRYYVEKEGFYVSLNFINDNVLYFKADNNKIYALDKGAIAYEYHFSDIYRLEKKFDNKLLIAGENKTLLVSTNFDLLAAFTTGNKPLVRGSRIFFVGDQQVYSVDMNTLR